MLESHVGCFTLIESLLEELSSSGWHLSWAFQFAEGHWRVSIIHVLECNGYDQPDLYHVHCADAPSLAEAIEDAMSKRAEAEFVEGNKQRYSLEPKPEKVDLVSTLGLRNATPIRRRV